MPTEQEAAVYSGMVSQSASDAAERRGQGEAGRPRRPRPGHAAEVDETRPASGRWSDAEQTKPTGALLETMMALSRGRNRPARAR